MISKYVRVSTVAEWLGVTPKRIYAMIQEGKLDAVRFGPRQTRIPRDSVETLLERLTRVSQETRGLDPDERKEIEEREFSGALDG